MTVKQKLYPQKIYQVNRAIDEFKKECGLGNQFIGFCALNYYNRKFNWYVVHKDGWDFTPKSRIVNNIKECCKKHASEWKEFLKELTSLYNEALKESIEYFDKIISNTNGISESSEEYYEEYYEEFHFHFLNIYQSYPIYSDKFFDGIIYRNLKKKKKRLKYAIADTLSDSDLKHTCTIYPWIDITFYYEDGEAIRSFSCQEYGKEGCDIEIEIGVNLTAEEIKSKIRILEQFQHTHVDKVYYYYLLPIMAGYPHPNSKEKPMPYNGKYKNDDNDEYLLKQEHIPKTNSLLFIPVYDAPIGKKLYGNFFGNITIPFESGTERNAFVDKEDRKNIKVIEENLFLLKK